MIQRKKYGKYYATIGLEIHVALQTKEKLFSDTLNSFDAAEISLFDAGVPGILPVLSKEPVEMAIAFGLAVDADIKKVSFFERKHYFYPDLPLGYQITQQHDPILIGGKVKIKSLDALGESFYKDIVIEHAHLECDAAKSIHDMYREFTAIDLSRCASPLLEIVSTPCMHSPLEAKEYAKAVHALATFMGICDGKLEEGSFRVDASISLSETEKLGTRVEIKNISSFAFLQSALEYEIERQKELLDTGKIIDMETRLFNESDLATYSMRKKETVDEYRYMPDPDIVPLVLEEEMLSSTKEKYLTTYFSLKEQLTAKLESYSMSLKDEEITALLSGRLQYLWLSFLSTPTLLTEKTVKILAFWLPEILAKDKLVQVTKQVTKEDIVTLSSSTLEAKECKETLDKYLSSELSLKEAMPVFFDSIAVDQIIDKVFSTYEEQVQKYKSGEVKMLQFLMGKVMSELKGKAPASQIKEKVDKRLSS